MKKLNLLALSAAVAGTFGSSAAVAEIEGLSANIGAVTQYFYRGVQQTIGAAAQGGVDYEHASGAYVGIWGSDVGGHSDVNGGGPGPDGVETDYYFGYGGEISDFSYGLGYTLYTYTGDFDTQYSEVNLNGGYGPISLEFSTGTHDKRDGAPNGDYTFTAVTYEYKDIAVTYGAWGSDKDGAYLEVGYSKSIDKLDFGISYINGDPAANAKNAATNGTALIFSIGTTFDL